MILATGAAGMVGSYLTEVYRENELVLTDIDTMDVRERDCVMATVEKLRPKLVIHLAAETDVDRCEQEADHAYKTNVIGTLNVALACQKFDAEVVYVSTLGVFDGIQEVPYTEFDPPAPVNVYSKTKYEGERIIQNLLRRYYIVRAGWLFGGAAKDKKFVAKIAALCRSKDELRIVDDKFGNPTYARDFLRSTKLVSESGFYGLYHVSNEGRASRYEVAQEIVDFLGLKTRLISIPSAAYPLPAPRPRSEAARNYKLELLNMNHMRPWRDALHDYLGSWSGRP